MEIKNYLRNEPAILLEKPRLRGLISDILLNDISKINLIMKVYDLGILESLKREFPLTNPEKNKYVLKLTRDYSIIQDSAIYAVDYWIRTLDKDVIDNLRTHEKEIDSIKKSIEKVELNNTATKKMSETELSDLASSLVTSKNEENYYQNPKIKKVKNVIYVPCGFGNLDFGFFIHGIFESPHCTHENAGIYALVYNFLIRNTIITNKDMPKFLKEDRNVNLDIKRVFKYAILLLLLIKNNYLKTDKVYFDNTRDTNEFIGAVRLINHYVVLFGALAKENVHGLKICNLKEKGCLDLSSLKTISFEDNKKVVSNARELWIERRFNYNLSIKDKPQLEALLSEISGYKSFKEGQLEVLLSMISCDEHAVCIMPTGSGKSLIYYMISLLQPLPVFIVAPTDTLIKDQLRNLRITHRFDNAAYLKLTESYNFSEFVMQNNLIYLTPDTFQTRNLMVKFREINQNSKIAYVVLDEIHCLSNWGHDFRPEYLMLSENLNTILDRTQFLGFTATANYTVVEDIQKQLDIPIENFFSPIAFDKFNIVYDYRRVVSTERMYSETANIVKDLIENNERTLIFTKSEEISQKLADEIGDEASVFYQDNSDSYIHFADGNCRVLISSEELGIGVNLPNVTNVIHFGLPVSKNEYVQEIGRAGRANERSKSFVVYLDKEAESPTSKLFLRNDLTNDVSNIIQQIDNDYTETYKKFSNGIYSQKTLYDSLFSMFRKFRSGGKDIYKETYKKDEIHQVKRNLYMLFVAGYVNNWYSHNVEKNGGSVDIIIDLQNSDNTFAFDHKKLINRMKKRITDYLVFMGNNRSYISRIERTDSIETILEVYIEWYYTKYLYHHKEQFIDFFEFIDRNQDCNGVQITKEIRDFFMLPFTKIKKDEKLFGSYSVQEIINIVLQGLPYNTIANIERINSNSFSYKYDLILFLNNIMVNQHFDGNRLDRIIRFLVEDERNEISSAIKLLYKDLGKKARLDIAKYFNNNNNLMALNVRDFITSVYSNNAKDSVYYGVLANMFNPKYESNRRK
jgi:RecQ family ATP-dependent DNA helicase